MRGACGIVVAVCASLLAGVAPAQERSVRQTAAETENAAPAAAPPSVATEADQADDGQEAPQIILSDPLATAAQAVGRLNRGPGPACTAVLVSPIHVLTAARCVHFPLTRALMPPGRLHFLAAFSGGAYAAHRVAGKVEPHPVYASVDPDEPEAYPVDIALVTLKAPITEVAPLAYDGAPPKDPATVSAVAYPKFRPAQVRVEDQCGALRGRGGVTIAACPVGEERAPLRGVDDGVGGALVVYGETKARLGGIIVARLPGASADTRLSVAAVPPKAWLERIAAARR